MVVEEEEQVGWIPFGRLCPPPSLSLDAISPDLWR